MSLVFPTFFFFFFNDTATTEIYTLSLHDALPILQAYFGEPTRLPPARGIALFACGALELFEALPLPHVHRSRSEEHTSELQSLAYLVCRLLLEKKKTKRTHSRSPPHSRDRLHLDF